MYCKINKDIKQLLRKIAINGKIQINDNSQIDWASYNKESKMLSFWTGEPDSHIPLVSIDEFLETLGKINQTINVLDMKPGEVGQVVDEADLTGSIVMCFKNKHCGPQVYTVKSSFTAEGDSKSFPGPWTGGKVKLVNLKDVL